MSITRPRSRRSEVRTSRNDAEYACSPCIVLRTGHESECKCMIHLSLRQRLPIFKCLRGALDKRSLGDNSMHTMIRARSSVCSCMSAWNFFRMSCRSYIKGFTSSCLNVARQNSNLGCCLAPRLKRTGGSIYGLFCFGQTHLWHSPEVFLSRRVYEELIDMGYGTREMTYALVTLMTPPSCASTHFPSMYPWL